MREFVDEAIEAERAPFRCEPRDIWTAMKRGLAERCPSCGRGKLFRRYLSVVDLCSVCGEELFHQRADDAPPYFTILVVAHIVCGGYLALDHADPRLPMWIHLTLWPVLTIVFSLFLLPRFKGALIGLQWANRMHGFGGAPTTARGAIG